MRLNPSNLAVLAGLLVLLACPEAAAAQDVFGDGGEELAATRSSDRRQSSEGAEFLLLPIGARAVGMGGAVTSLRGAGDLVMWNPASVASLGSSRLLFNHGEGAFDTSSDVLAFLWPLRSVGTFAVTYYLVDFGELSSTGIDGSQTGTINFRNQEFLLSFATRLVGALEAGVNYKLIQLVFRCDGVCGDQRSFTSTTHALDLGMIYDRPAGLPFTVGGSIRHLGFPLQGASMDDPLPTRVRMGLTYRPLSGFTRGQPFGLAVAVDVEDQWRDLGDPAFLVGSELALAQQFFLRAGYAFLDKGLGGPSLGLGLTYDWLYVDLSRGFDDVSAATGDEAIQVTFGVVF